MKRPECARYLAFAAAWLLALPVGCNSIFAKKRPPPDPEDDYEYVMAVGSNIPVRVKKASKAGVAPPVGTVSATTAASPAPEAGTAVAPIPSQKP